MNPDCNIHVGTKNRPPVIVAKLREISALLYRFDPRAKSEYRLAEFALWAESAAEQFIFWETSMRTVNETVAALVADDKAKRQQIADLQAQLDAANAALATAQADAIFPDTLAAVNELVPEVPAA